MPIICYIAFSQQKFSVSFSYISILWFRMLPPGLAIQCRQYPSIPCRLTNICNYSGFFAHQSLYVYIYIFVLNFSVTLILFCISLSTFLNLTFCLLWTIYLIDCNYNSFIMNKYIELKWGNIRNEKVLWLSFSYGTCWNALLACILAKVSPLQKLYVFFHYDPRNISIHNVISSFWWRASTARWLLSKIEIFNQLNNTMPDIYNPHKELSLDESGALEGSISVSAIHY